MPPAAHDYWWTDLLSGVQDPTVQRYDMRLPSGKVFKDGKSRIIGRSGLYVVPYPGRANYKVMMYVQPPRRLMLTQAVYQHGPRCVAARLCLVYVRSVSLLVPSGRRDAVEDGTPDARSNG